eukprot:scaffold290146_cov19-Prasinocladus_malaysianus.AAC.1
MAAHRRGCLVERQNAKVRCLSAGNGAKWLAATYLSQGLVTIAALQWLQYWKLSISTMSLISHQAVLAKY